MLNGNLQRIYWILYWMLTTAVAGMAIIGVGVLLLADSIEQALSGGSTIAFLLAAPLAGAIAGGLSGLLQWLLLRRVMAKSHGWLLVSIIGWAAALTLCVAVFFWLAPEGLSIITLIVPPAAAGLTLAAVQWRVLRNTISGQGWWLAAGATGWIIALIVGLVFSGGYEQLLTTSPGLFILIPGAIFGAILGFQTGFALVVLLSYAARETGSQILEPPKSERSIP